MIDPVVKMIYLNRPTPSPFHRKTLPHMSPTIHALHELLEESLENASGKREHTVSFFGDQMEPLILASQNLAIKEADIESIGLAPHIVNDLRSFEWLGQIVDALSTPGALRTASILTAIQAILAVEDAKIWDHHKQRQERPDQHPWEVFWCHGSTPIFFITSHGFLGSHSACSYLPPAKPGDSISRLAAHSYPVILRPNESRKFKVVAECSLADPGLREVDNLTPSEMEWFEIV